MLLFHPKFDFSQDSSFCMQLFLYMFCVVTFLICTLRVPNITRTSNIKRITLTFRSTRVLAWIVDNTVFTWVFPISYLLQPNLSCYSFIMNRKYLYTSGVATSAHHLRVKPIMVESGSKMRKLLECYVCVGTQNKEENKSVQLVV